MMVTVLPFVVGVGLFLASQRPRRLRYQLVFTVTGSFCLLGSLFYTWALSPYIWALHLEAQWRPAKPESKIEMESYLSLYTQREIVPSDLDWNPSLKLKEGERMVRYAILQRAPLDVVYTSDDTLVSIYTTYE